jgi:hypothetical protein
VTMRIVFFVVEWGARVSMLAATPDTIGGSGTSDGDQAWPLSQLVEFLRVLRSYPPRPESLLSPASETILSHWSRASSALALEPANGGRLDLVCWLSPMKAGEKVSA